MELAHVREEVGGTAVLLFKGVIASSSPFTLIREARISDCAKKVIRNPTQLRAEAAYSLTRAFREVSIDAAFVEYGDDWPNHINEYYPITFADGTLKAALDILTKGE